MAAEGPVPTGIPHLDHVFVIMMENHSFGQVIGNPTMPFINSQIKKGEVNLATNYFAVGHPSLTNYLEIVGGSNFGVRSDNHAGLAQPQLPDQSADGRPERGQRQRHRAVSDRHRTTSARSAARARTR